MLDTLLNGANPAFALTVRMRSCRRIFLCTALFFLVAASGITAAILSSPSTFLFLSFPTSASDFFEIAFLSVTACSLVFLGSDFGAVFIEATFQDELLRLTPMTPLDIVHGGMLASLFFSIPLLVLALAFLPPAYLLGLPVERVFWGTLLLFLTGQTLNVVLLSSYISARNWRQIGFGAVSAFLLILSFVGFCFTRLGAMLLDEKHWPLPMLFLLVVFALLFFASYLLSRNHANSPKRSFRTTIIINFLIYCPFWLLACFLAVFLVGPIITSPP